jgi:hypothetical protein
MATIVDTPVAPMPDARPRARRGRLFLWLAIACAAVAIGGFMPSYWLQLAPRTFTGQPLLHMHGIACTAWVLFLISQAWLVSQGRLRNHRNWGLAGISLASVVVLLGIATAIIGLEERLAHGFGDAARSFLVTPMSAILRFAVFTGAAIACVHRPEWHKRLMIVGTVALIEAAGARVALLMAVGTGPGVRPSTLPLPPPAMPVIVGLLLQLLIVAGMIHDKRTRGSVHPAWIVGLVASVAVILLKEPISTTPAWLAFAQWTTTIAG